MKKKVGFDFDLLKDKLAFDHLFTMREESSADEIQYKIFLKLLGRGARLAFKRTSEAIYYGRAGAFRTGKMWKTGHGEDAQVVDEKQNELITYPEYMRNLSFSKGKIEDWIPFHDVYSSITEPILLRKIPRKTYRLKPVSFSMVTGKFEKQESFRTLFMSALSIREHDDYETKKFREKLEIPWRDYPGFLSFCESENIKPSDYISKLMSRFERNKTSNMKCLSPCFNTKSLNDTLNAMVKLSSSYDELYIMEKDYDVRYKVHDLMKYTDLIVLEKLEWAEIQDEDLDGMKDLLSDVNFISKMTRRYEKSLTMLAFRCLRPKEAHSFCMRNGLLVIWYIVKQNKSKYTGEWSGDLVLGVSGRGNSFLVCQEGEERFLKINKINPRTLYGALKSVCQELNWEIESLLKETKTVLIGDYFRIGRSFRECQTVFRSSVQVLKWKTLPYTPTPIREGWLGVKINDRGQLEIRTDGVVYLNYSVKFNLSILNNSDKLVKKSGTDLMYMIQKAESQRTHTNVSEEEYELEDFDYDEFTRDIYSQDMTKEQEDFQLMLEVPEKIIEDGGFEDFDLSDFFESMSEEPKRYVVETLRELRSWLYRNFPDDDPTLIPKEMAVSKLQWMYDKQDAGLLLDEFSEFIINEYCMKIGVLKDNLWNQFETIITNSIPVVMLTHKKFLKSGKITLLLRDI
jgi:hypothetical protein